MGASTTPASGQNSKHNATLHVALHPHVHVSYSLFSPPPLVKPCALETCGVCGCNTACHPCQHTRELGDARRLDLPDAPELLCTCKQTHTQKHMQHTHVNVQLCRDSYAVSPSTTPTKETPHPSQTSWSRTPQPHPIHT